MSCAAEGRRGSAGSRLAAHGAGCIRDVFSSCLPSLNFMRHVKESFTVHFNGPFALTRPHWQVSYATRVISVDEYDAAVMREPGACPLIAAGDLRSGRQARRPADLNIKPGLHTRMLLSASHSVLANALG